MTSLQVELPAGVVREVVTAPAAVLSTPCEQVDPADPEVVQLAVLTGVAFALGWRPPMAGWLPALAGLALGTLAFAGIGLLIAGTLPGLVTLAVTNGLYLVLLLTGGMIVPVDELPGPMAAVSRVLPAAPLVEITTGSLTPDASVAPWAWITLTLWAAAAPLAAVRWFRWE